jgi:hypothetical protein
VAVGRTDVSEEGIASSIMVIRIDELRTSLAENRNRIMLLRNTANVVRSSPIVVTLVMEVLRSSETSVLTTAMRHNISEEGILQSHRPEDLKSYIALIGWAV